MARGLVELLKEHIADTRLQKERVRNTLAADLIPNDVKHHRLLDPFPRHRDLDRGAFRTLQQIGNLGGIEIIGWRGADHDDHVTGFQSRFVRRRPDERRHDDGFAVAALHRHADAIIMTALFLTETFQILGIEEVGMGIERPQHLRDRTLVNRLVGAHGVREVLLDRRVDLRERFHAGFDVVVSSGGGSNFEPRTIHSADNGGAQDQERDEIERAAIFSHAGE